MPDDFVLQRIPSLLSARNLGTHANDAELADAQGSLVLLTVRVLRVVWLNLIFS
jgi:hypothetical protein